MQTKSRSDVPMVAVGFSPRSTRPASRVAERRLNVQCGWEVQPSLRDEQRIPNGPWLESHGYRHEVAPRPHGPGERPAISSRHRSHVRSVCVLCRNPSPRHHWSDRSRSVFQSEEKEPKAIMKHSRRFACRYSWAFTVVILLIGLATDAPAKDEMEFLWASQLGGNKGQSGNGMAVDQIGNIYVTGIAGQKSHRFPGTHGQSRSGGEAFVTKLSPAGKVLWRQAAGDSGSDAGLAVAVDKTGGVYVAGYFSGNIKFGDVKLQAAEDKETHKYSPADVFLARYDAGGKLVWVRRAGGPSMDQPYAVATDKEGNAYITGCFQGKATFGTVTMESKTRPDGYHQPDTEYGDVFVAKYNPSGTVIWVRRAGERWLNVGHSIDVDSAENVYVTGRFAHDSRDGGSIRFGGILVTDTNLCNFIAKYDRDGNIVWAQPTAGVGEHRAANNSVAVDRSNNVFVAGSFIFSQTIDGTTLTELPGGNKDVFLVKYDANGKVLWCRQGGGKSHETCQGFAVDEEGNAYLTGSFDESASFGAVQIRAKDHDPRISGYESFVACYRPGGDVAWVSTIHRNADMRGIALDNLGQVIVMGGFRDLVTFGSTTLKSGKDVVDVFIAKQRKE